MSNSRLSAILQNPINKKPNTNMAIHDSSSIKKERKPPIKRDSHLTAAANPTTIHLFYHLMKENLS